MALNPNQQNAFNRQINRMKEDGFFLPARRSLSGDTRYLIISYGGTGAAALFGVKKQFETVLPKAQLAERVRFLAIDTDKATKESSKKITNPDGTTSIVILDRLDADQFAQLSGSSARVCLNDASIAEWINPTVKQKIDDDKSLLVGTGASGIRQLGRVSLYPHDSKNLVAAKVHKLVKELTDDNKHPLRVFILSGISGGTGSGTVVDLTYLIRNVLENMPGQLDSPDEKAITRTKYCGFLLLPPTGTSDSPVEINHGNRNGYAALKEITHFMNIKTRKGEYDLIYSDGSVVTSTKNIFDVCYLLDGTSDGKAFGKPREQAIRVLAESVLDMICASETTAAGDTIATVDSFMNDHSTMKAQMVTAKSTTHAVRDADYIYCALGHSEFAMPIHQIKAYVAKQMFDKIHKLFLNCGNVDKDDVTSLLQNILRKGAETSSAAVRSMEDALEPLFTNPRGGKGGPYFTINLLRDLVDEVRTQHNKLRAFRVGMASNQALDNIEKYALHVNNTTFNVYTAAMDALKSMMDEQFGVVVKAGVNGNTYSFIPESMGSISGAEYVIRYLDGLINKGTLFQLTEAMLKEMISNRDAWTSLISNEDPTAAPNAMRRFWNEQLDKIINSTLEDFLIKYYAQDPEASYSIETHEQTYPHLQKAAEAIYNSMLGEGGSAQPMVGLTPSGLQSSDFNAHTFLMVPERAPNLHKELTKIAAGAPAGLQVKVCTSMASDRISCYKQYTSIPAFKLDWACSAEHIYEQDIKTAAGVGTHMSETAGGNQWKNFPNLLPKSCWHLVPKANYTNPREAALAAQAAQLFDRAKDLKLTVAMHSVAGLDVLDYKVMVLPKAMRPDDALFRELDRCVEGSDLKRQKLAAIDEKAEQCAAALFTKVSSWQTDTQVPTDLANAGVAFDTRDLFFSDSIHTVGPADERPDNWDEYMAQCELRRLPNVMNEVNGTVMVMEKLMAKVTRATQAKKLITLFAQYLITDMFKFNVNTQTWQYADSNGFPEDLVFIGNEMMRLSEYYYMFDAFRNNPETIAKAMQAKFDEVIPLPGTANLVTKNQAFIAAANKFKEAVSAWNMNPPIDPYIAVMNAAGYNVTAIKNFYRALFNEFNTMALVGYIPVSLVPPAPVAPAAPAAENFLF